MPHDDIEIIGFTPEYTDELVAMWRAGSENALGIADWRPLEDQKQFFLNDVVPNNDVRVVLHDGAVIAFIAATRESVSQLHVHLGWQHRGLGTRLLNWAKEQSDGSLWLYTFARNTRACAFYEYHGFTAVEHGFEEEWQLEDVRYEWAQSGGAS